MYGGADNHQLPCSLNPPRPAAVTVDKQTGYLLLDLITLLDGSYRIFFSNIVNDLFKITQRL